MSGNPDMNQEFDKISREIAEAESALRSRFVATPAVDPAVLPRIKTRLQAEARTMRASDSQPGMRTWLRTMAAVAATILLATGLYTMTGPAGDINQQAARATASLETFTASLPGVMADEDAEMAELRSELRQLEAQTAGNTVDTGSPGDPAAQHGTLDHTASLTTTGPAAEEVGSMERA